jgi:hypothetical protein
LDTASHRIRRQRWLVKAPSQEAAFAIRQQLRTQLDSALLPAFERAFDALDIGNDVVRIPRLTIDLRLRPGEDVGTVLAYLLRERLGDILREAAISHPGQTGVHRLAAHASRRQILLRYLATGHVTWHASGGDAESLSQALQTEALALAHKGQPLGDVIIGSLAQRAATGFRLLQLLTSEARPPLLAQAPLHVHASLPDRFPATADAVITILAGVLRQLAVPAVLSDYLLLRVQALLLALREEDVRNPLDPLIVALLRECLERAVLHTSAAARLRAALQSLANVASDAEVFPTARKDTTYLAQPVTRASNEAPDEDGSFPAQDAGLVLLHPYVTRLFETLGIAPAGARGLPEFALPRAAALLHWLLSGREEVFEFELSTIKVLLGLAPERMLPVASGLLSDEDRAEADHLLAAAITHWAALGKTSVAALRGSFLQRRGVLRDIGRGWELRVEPQSFDMLVGKLPWGISIVKLPWMTRPIFTEWPTP